MQGGEKPKNPKMPEKKNVQFYFIDCHSAVIVFEHVSKVR